MKFINSSKHFSTEDDVEDVTNLVIQVENNTHYGYFTIKIDDGVGKVLNISLQDYKEEIPNTTFFWLMMIVPLSVLGVNIFSIVKIQPSAEVISAPIRCQNQNAEVTSALDEMKIGE